MMVSREVYATYLRASEGPPEFEDLEIRRVPPTPTSTSSSERALSSRISFTSNSKSRIARRLSILIHELELAVDQCSFRPLRLL